MSQCCQDIIIEMSGQGSPGKTGNSIASIEKTGSSGLTDVYTITMTWGQTYTFEVENGNGIASIELLNTDVLDKTYRITFTNGDHYDFSVSDGNGIASISLLSEVGLVKTYRISFTDGDHFDFNVKDGNGIVSVTKSGTNVLEDTYTILFSNNTTTNFTVKNGRGIVSITKTSSADLVDTYTVQYNDNTTSTFTVTNGEAATVTVGTVTTGEPGTSASVTNVGDDHNAVLNFTIPKGDTGDPGTYIWGDITGTLSDQTDLQNALDAKANASDVYTKTQTDNLLSAKANTADLGDLAGMDSISYTSDKLTDKPTLGDLAGMDSIDYTSDKLTNKPTLGALADHDTVDYETEVTNKPTLGTMSAEDASDYYDKTTTDALLAEKADIIHSSASGSIVSITDGAPYPVDALSVSIEPVQDLHGYDAPWPAGGSANIWDEQWELGTFNSDHQWVSGSYVGTKNLVKVTAGATYYSKCSANIKYVFYDANSDFVEEKDVASNSTFTAPATADTMRFRTYQAYGSTYNNDIAINYPSTVITYAPYSNICPISGHTSAVVTRMGKNILVKTIVQSATTNDVTFTVNTDGSITVNGTASANTTFSFIRKADNNFGVYPAGTYTFSGVPSNLPSGVSVYWQVNDGDTYISQTLNNNNLSKTVIVTDKLWMDTSQTRNCYIYVANGTVCDHILITPQLEVGSIATAYEEPTRQSVTIDLDGTRYGGTLDVLTGMLTVTHGYATLNTTWSYQNTEGHERFGSEFLKTVIKAPSANGDLADIICSSYKTITASQTYTHGNGIGIGVDTSGAIWVYDPAYTDGATFKSAVASVQVVYPLATPLTVQLDPHTLSLLLGDNNIWADTGSTSVGYRADTKMYIERLTAPTEDDMIANANIASGKFFMVGNSLFYSTTSIASGEKIIVGTNCTALSLADALNNLNS